MQEKETFCEGQPPPTTEISLLLPDHRKPLKSELCAFQNFPGPLLVHRQRLAGSLHFGIVLFPTPPTFFSFFPIVIITNHSHTQTLTGGFFKHANENM